MRDTESYSRQLPSTGAFTAANMTVCCDFDGPIVDVSDRYYHTYRLGLANTQTFYRTQDVLLPIRVLTKKQFWQLKQDRTPDTDIAMRSGLCQSDQIRVFLEAVARVVNDPALSERDLLQPGVRQALLRLYREGANLVVVTLRHRDQVAQILQNYGLEGCFSHIYGTHNLQDAYQNYSEIKTRLLADALAAHLARGQSRQAIWMVGDTEADILAGQALNIPTIALTCGIRSPLYLKKFHPTLMREDLLSATDDLLLACASVASCG